MSGSYLLLSFFFLVGWIITPLKVFQMGPPPHSKKPPKWSSNIIFSGKGKTIYILGNETLFESKLKFKRSVKRLIFPSLCVEKRNREFEALGRKIPLARQTSKMAQHNLFFFLMLKCTEFFWKYLLERGKKKVILHTGEEGDRLAQERVTWRSTKASRHPFPRAYKSPWTKYKEVTKQEKQI